MVMIGGRWRGGQSANVGVLRTAPPPSLPPFTAFARSRFEVSVAVLSSLGVAVAVVVEKIRGKYSDSDPHLSSPAFCVASVPA